MGIFDFLKRGKKSDTLAQKQTIEDLKENLKAYEEESQKHEQAHHHQLQLLRGQLTEHLETIQTKDRIIERLEETKDNLAMINLQLEDKVAALTKENEKLAVALKKKTPKKAKKKKKEEPTDAPEEPRKPVSPNTIFQPDFARYVIRRSNK